MMDVNEAARKLLDIRTADGIMRHAMFRSLAGIRRSLTGRPWPSTLTLEEIDQAVAEEFVIWWCTVEESVSSRCGSCLGKKGSYEPAIAHTDVWVDCVMCKGTGVRS